MLSLLTILFVLLFTTLSVIYVYKFRGQARFENAVEYLRKGWPIFAPLNVLLYLSTRGWARKPFLAPSAFHNLKLLEDNWHIIAEEAIALQKAGYFEQTASKSNKSFYDVGFRTFYKYGWSKFYCTWYGTELNSALVHCPKTLTLLRQIPSINGAMFTILSPNSQLTRHLDPIACSFRYHLGLSTPNSSQCFINVDGQAQSWRDGEAFIFDETFLHYVENNTSETRLILMCDLERPMSAFGRLFNWLYKKLVRLMLVPNLPGDQAGPVNRLFSRVTPWLSHAKQLKKHRPRLYYPLKWLFNLSLLALLFGIVWASIAFIAFIFS